MGNLSVTPELSHLTWGRQTFLELSLSILNCLPLLHIWPRSSRLQDGDRAGGLCEPWRARLPEENANGGCSGRGPDLLESRMSPLPKAPGKTQDAWGPFPAPLTPAEAARIRPWSWRFFQLFRWSSGGHWLPEAKTRVNVRLPILTLEKITYYSRRVNR